MGRESDWEAFFRVLVGGFRNGAWYGLRLRFPHALLMTLLYSRGSVAEMCKRVLGLTQRHALRLGLFAVVYKAIKSVLEKCGLDLGLRSFSAGLIGGALVWGERDAVNMQLALYIFSRVCLTLWNRFVQPSNACAKRVFQFPLFSAVVWGLVMCIWEGDAESLPPSLTSSMNFIYGESGVSG